MLGTSYLTKTIYKENSKHCLNNTSNRFIIKSVKLNNQQTKKCVHRVQNSQHAMILRNITPEVFHDSSFSSHIDYVLLMENIWNGQRWVVRRRFSSFFHLRNQIEAILDIPHCHYCAEAYDAIKLAQFPARRLIGSSSRDVMLQRTEAFKTYMRQIIKVVTTSYYRNCSLITKNLRHILYSFITGDSTNCLNLSSDESPENEDNETYAVPSLLQELSRSCRYANCVPLDTIYENDDNNESNNNSTVNSNYCDSSSPSVTSKYLNSKTTSNNNKTTSLPPSKWSFKNAKCFEKSSISNNCFGDPIFTSATDKIRQSLQY